MSGGGGGGGDKKKQEAAAPVTPYNNLPVAQTFQPSLPGFQGMLAQQLSQGFGGGAPDFASLLSNLYSPMNIYRFQEPISTTAAMYDKSKHAPISTGNVALDRLLMGQEIGGKDGDKKKGSD